MAGFFDTSAKFDINKNAGAGLVGAGKALSGMSDVQIDKKKRAETKEYKDASMQIQKNQDERSQKRLQNEEAETKRIIEKAKSSKEEKVKLEDATIKAFESKHPIFMGMKTKDGKPNESYNNLTREDKIALIKLASNEAYNPKSPSVVNVTTREDGQRIAIYKDGTIKDLGFKAKTDWNKASDIYNGLSEEEYGIAKTKERKEAFDRKQAIKKSDKFISDDSIKMDINKKEIDASKVSTNLTSKMDIDKNKIIKNRNTRELIKAKQWAGTNKGKAALAGTWLASDEEIIKAYRNNK